jgi:hypothetical protein
MSRVFFSFLTSLIILSLFHPPRWCRVPGSLRGCTFTSWQVTFVKSQADVVYDFSGWAPGSTVKNTGFDSSVGAATVRYASYTTASPSYVTVSQGVLSFIQAPMISGVRTMVMVARVKPSNNWAHFFDARGGVGAGWFADVGKDMRTRTTALPCVTASFSTYILLDRFPILSHASTPIVHLCLLSFVHRRLLQARLDRLPITEVCAYSYPAATIRFTLRAFSNRRRLGQLRRLLP